LAMWCRARALSFLFNNVVKLNAGHFRLRRRIRFETIVLDRLHGFAEGARTELVICYGVRDCEPKNARMDLRLPSGSSA
jgi:hypothetical protein